MCHGNICFLHEVALSYLENYYVMAILNDISCLEMANLEYDQIFSRYQQTTINVYNSLLNYYHCKFDEDLTYANFISCILEIDLGHFRMYSKRTQSEIASNPMQLYGWAAVCQYHKTQYL